MAQNKAIEESSKEKSALPGGDGCGGALHKGQDGAKQRASQYGGDDEQIGRPPASVQGTQR
ncbi:hypothetical protein UVI_02003120 [Ustilaginoidea virens]|uniref:Uncharacterized protein n=1 Tax=Ustilaginoidea virens TaxID=1159556 RepID=A0A1B5L4S2_USTVR|nr:hypothetical protein UVI_02003120 [Ustilaginoidea virens]